MTTALSPREASPREAVGATYDLATIKAAQAKSWEALHAIAAQVRPGMTEAEATAMGKGVLADMGMELAWHPLLIRFGENTLKIFSDRSEGTAILGENDIWFVDMGPVFHGHEGDAGATFTTGSDAEMQACARDVKMLFDTVATLWNGGTVTGETLYEAARAEAEKLGWVINLDIQGHRVGDYPHSVHNGGKLGEFGAAPTPGLWILEMQIRHPTRNFGAFYEDLLA